MNREQLIDEIIDFRSLIASLEEKNGVYVGLTASEWIEILRRYIIQSTPENLRVQMVRVAAVALAAAESVERFPHSGPIPDRPTFLIAHQSESS